MTKEKHAELVKLISEKSTLQPPALIYNDYDNWRTKATLARLLTSYGLNYPEEAIELFRDVVAIPLNETSEDMDADVDLMAWALRDLSDLERHQGDNELSLEHINQAIKLAESRNVDYSFTVRGNLMSHKFLTLCQLGREQEAETMANDMIENHKNPDILNNSYIFYGYKCKARLAVIKGNSAEIKKFMLQALEGVDPSDKAVIEATAELESIDISNISAKDLFNKMYKMLPDAFHCITWWDMPGMPPWTKENSDKD